MTRGSKSWVALVEIKTGAATLSREQVECYLDVARENGFDAVLTISNELSARAGVHPLTVDGRKTRKVTLAHLSWAEVLTAAVQQRVHRGVADPDQAWILAELIRYLQHQKSGALDFADMGSSLVEVREAVAAGTLRANDKGLPEVVARWNQLLRFVALRLGRELGAEVQVVEPRKAAADPGAFLKEVCQRVVADGTLSGTVWIPNAIAPLNITADLRASRIEVSAEVEAPRDGRSLTRVNWLLRQLRDAPEALRIDVWAANARTSVSERLSVLRENPDAVVADPKKPPKTFRIALVRPLGAKRDAARGSFIASTLGTVDEFYSEVLQALRPWSAKPPQLAKVPPTAVEKAGIDLSQPPRDFEILGVRGRAGECPPKRFSTGVVWSTVQYRLWARRVAAQLRGSARSAPAQCADTSARRGNDSARRSNGRTGALLTLATVVVVIEVDTRCWTLVGVSREARVRWRDPCAHLEVRRDRPRRSCGRDRCNVPVV